MIFLLPFEITLEILKQLKYSIFLLSYYEYNFLKFGWPYFKVYHGAYGLQAVVCIFMIQPHIVFMKQDYPEEEGNQADAINEMKC